MSNPPTFGRPGRPRKITLCDLFLWDPFNEFDIMGISLSEVFSDDHGEFLSVIRDVKRRRPISEARARAAISNTLQTFGCPLVVALDGDEASGTQRGQWETYLTGRNGKPGGILPVEHSLLGQHVIELEKALVEPTKAFHAKDFAGCAEILKSSQVVARHLWPEVLEGFRTATDEMSVLHLRALVSLEIQFSCLAYQGAQLTAHGVPEDTMSSVLFASFEDETDNSRYFDWLATYSGAGANLAASVPQLSKAAKDFDLASAKRQLRRWKNGNGFPSRDVLEGLFQSLFGDLARNKDDPNYSKWITSRIMTGGYKRAMFVRPILRALKQHPMRLPSGHRSIDEWKEARCAHWYRHWASLIKV